MIIHSTFIAKSISNLHCRSIISSTLMSLNMAIFISPIFIIVLVLGGFLPLLVVPHPRERLRFEPLIRYLLGWASFAFALGLGHAQVDLCS